MRTRLFPVIAASLALLAGCGNRKAEKIQLGYAGQTSAPAAAAEDAPTSATGPVQVAREHVPVVPVDVVQENGQVRLTGSLLADEQSEVASRAGGIVESILVDRGSVVRKGDVLVKLDSVNARNALAEGLASVQELAVRLGIRNPEDRFDPAQQPEVKSAKAALDLAEVTFKRNADLHARRVIATAEFDRAKSDYESARQHYEQAWHQAAQLYQSYRTALVRLRSLRQAVEDTVVTAPFDGLVAEKHVAPGEMLGGAGGGAGSRVVTLLRIDPLRLMITVPARHITQVRPGQQVRFQVDALPGQTFTATVTRVSPALEAESRSLTVEARVDNPDRQLRPGMFATAQLLLPQQKPSLYVPPSAVRRQGEIARVYVVEDGVVREKIVTVGETTDGRVQVTTGLEAGDRVIADAAQASDGMRVQ